MILLLFYNLSHLVVLKVLTNSTNYLASGSFSKCYLTGSIKLLIAAAVAFLRSPGWQSPLSKSFTNSS